MLQGQSKHLGKRLIDKADVSIFSEAQALIKTTIEGLGEPIFWLIMQGSCVTLIMMMSEEDWDVVQSTNLKSTFNCSKSCIAPHDTPALWKNYYTSVAGQIGNAGQSNHSASSGADWFYQSTCRCKQEYYSKWYRCWVYRYRHLVESPEDARQGLMHLILLVERSTGRYSLRSCFFCFQPGILYNRTNPGSGWWYGYGLESKREKCRLKVKQLSLLKSYNPSPNLHA